MLLAEIKKGVFCFSGKNLMLCFYNDEAATRAVKYTDDDGIEWFHTDTYGHMDEKTGYILTVGKEDSLLPMTAAVLRIKFIAIMFRVWLKSIIALVTVLL